MKNQKVNDKLVVKKCFVITPIGEESSVIRRNIEGLMESVILPVFKELDMIEPEVSHKMVIPGSITKAIITSIYNADFIIANLAELNPNVMYELGFAHSARKPVIHLAPNGENLPFDIKDQRTLFYDNDMKGVVLLKSSLKEMILSIADLKNVDENPIINGVKEFTFKMPEVQEINIIDAMEKIQREIGDINYKISEIRNERYRNVNREIAFSNNDIRNLRFENAFKQLHNDLGRIPSIEECYAKTLEYGFKSDKEFQIMYLNLRNKFLHNQD